MSTKNFSFSTTTERLNKIENIIKNPETMSSFINRAIDHEIHNIETKYLSDFIYYLGLPTLAFLSMVFICLYFALLFLYIITVVLGIYIIVLFYLFYNKHHKEKR